MSKYVKMVKEFHEANGLPVRSYLDISMTWSQERLRFSLLREEFDEYQDAIMNPDFAGVADALADMLYIIHGTALVYGFDMDAIFKEVHRSNMSKLGEGGKPVLREDGKVLKGPNYSPTDLASIIFGS